MWITVSFDSEGRGIREKYSRSKVSFNNDKTILSNRLDARYRTSQIFSITDNNSIPSEKNYSIYFYNYPNPYILIGQILDEGSSELKNSVWYNIGLSSILLIASNEGLDEELRGLSEIVPRTSEHWTIKENGIVDHKIQTNTKPEFDRSKCEFLNYDILSLVERATIDEFVSNIDIIIPKIAVHNPSELDTFYSLIEDINELISELVYLKVLDSNVPATLKEYTQDQLNSHSELRVEIFHQNIERIIQINSALSYISTQSLSGAVPILERRGLVRRHSLLGIGNAAMALNRITRSIEISLQANPIVEIILDRMNDNIPLPGATDLLNYNSSKWNEYSFDRWKGKLHTTNAKSTKIPFFSGRLGFRETEYTISAAIQCISAGAGLEWNLITLTHEMMHSHVRTILTTLFHGDVTNGTIANREIFYDNFDKHVHNKTENLKLIDYLRNIVFMYLCYSYSHGSITNIRKSIPRGKTLEDLKPDLYLLPQDLLWEQFEKEHRNINEIIVHILDFHYFYDSRINVYVPMVWKSWSSLPYIYGDVHQYILRTLLVISTAYTESDVHKRFNSSVKKMLQIIDKHIDRLLDLPVIHKVIKILTNKIEKDKLLLPFKTSLILVDLANNIFVTASIKGDLYDDPFVDRIDLTDSLEQTYIYNLPDGFNNASIKRPAAFLLYNYIKQIEDPIDLNKLEAYTARYFLACNSK